MYRQRFNTVAMMVRAAVEDTDPDSFAQFVAELDQTNCWYVLYWLKPTLQKYVEDRKAEPSRADYE